MPHLAREWIPGNLLPGMKSAYNIKSCTTTIWNSCLCNRQNSIVLDFKCHYLQLRLRKSIPISPSCGWGGGGGERGGTQQRVIQGGSAPGSQPLSFYILFLTGKVTLSYTFHRKWKPLLHTYNRLSQKMFGTFSRNGFRATFC